MVMSPRAISDSVYTFLVDRLASTRSYMSGWVNDGRLDHPGDVGRVHARPRVLRRGGEADLVVHDDVHRAAGPVSAQQRQVQRLGHHALPGERGIAVDEHG